jgi:UTP:GlnB (protein PII) uridylyltransferase
VDISLAKINTTHGVADDAFYVTDADGRQILAPERQEQIRARLIEALASLG